MPGGAKFWAEARNTEVLKHGDVVAVKWKLSSRHPVFDLCDMYAKADMYGLGAGVFPKDKVPALPVHPHCLCRMVEIYREELKGKEKERIREAGDEWLKKLNKVQRERVLGIEGEKAWQKGGDWREYARGWAGLREANSRLPKIKTNDTIKLKDIEIGRSLGARAKNYDVLDPRSGEYFHFAEGTKIQNASVFAGKGVTKPLNYAVKNGLSIQFGGDPSDWAHCKGIGVLDYYGEYRPAEVHWFQCAGIGKVKFKIKRWQDES